MKSNVGVLSEVLLSVVLEPVSEFTFRSGADKAASPTLEVDEDVAVAVLKTEESMVTVPTSTVRKNFPTSEAVNW